MQLRARFTLLLAVLLSALPGSGVLLGAGAGTCGASDGLRTVCVMSALAAAPQVESGCCGSSDAQADEQADACCAGDPRAGCCCSDGASQQDHESARAEPARSDGACCGGATRPEGVDLACVCSQSEGLGSECRCARAGTALVFPATNLAKVKSTHAATPSHPLTRAVWIGFDPALRPRAVEMKAPIPRVRDRTCVWLI